MTHDVDADAADFADYEWLVDAEAARRLQQVDQDRGDELALLRRLRKDLPAARARLIVQQSALRRRAREKFGVAAARMFFTPQLLEQASDVWIANYKAARLASSSAIATLDLCCGIGGDLLGFAGKDRAVGWDRSPIARLLAERNVAAALGDAAGSRTQVQLGDIQQVQPEPSQPWHIDPDRRATGARRTDPGAFSPGPVDVERLRQGSRCGAIKLAPASRPPAEWADSAEFEWISRDRQCRQLVVWLDGVATAPGQCRATRVHSSDDPSGQQAVTFLGQPAAVTASASTVSRFVLDADPAIHAAGLLGSFAEQHQLAVVGRGGGYLTTETPGATPLAQRFEVCDVLPWRAKQLADYLRLRDVGVVEIKTRGVDVRPDALRRRLKLRGDNSAVVILTRIDQRRIAVVANRVDPHS